MITSATQFGSDKIPSSLQMRFMELIKTLELKGKRVLDLSNEPDCIGQDLPGSCFRNAEVSYIWNMHDEVYDVLILYSAFRNFPAQSIDSVIERMSECIKDRLVIIEDLPIDVFSEKELEIKQMIMPEYQSHLNGNIEAKLKESGFKKIEKKIWASQIPLSEDEVARKIRILSRMAIERKIDVGKELQQLLSIYRIHRPIFTYKELTTACKS